jgi:hypothetical protein
MQGMQIPLYHNYLLIDESDEAGQMYSPDLNIGNKSFRVEISDLP